MKTTLWKLKNVIKNYDWGSIDGIAKRFHIDNPEHKPMAELWMGVHPAGTSIAINALGESCPLNQIIQKSPIKILGQKTYQKFNNLPYLFKILSAQQPLSIQVHPELSKAIEGFKRENQLGIPINSPERNYKDANHKPELIYAITPFLAMNGFQPVTDIIEHFEQLNISVLKKCINELRHNATSDGLKVFFYRLLTLEKSLKQQAIAELVAYANTHNQCPYNIIKMIAKIYPDDSGIFAPLILNVIKLNPGQAMYIKAQTPHAYISGTGLEIMASSDNVLRAGLTSKHIDITELFKNTCFDTSYHDHLLTQPIKHKNKIAFPVPVEDFAFEIITGQLKPIKQLINSAEILLCIDGNITIKTETDNITLTAGESVFIACCAKAFEYQGEGTFARAFNH